MVLETDLDRFIAVDIAFHKLVLSSSGNALFAHLGDVTAEVLHGRLQLHLMPPEPDSTAITQHLQVAEAIRRGDADNAERILRMIVISAADEVDRMLDG
jgi:DNA-binding FadR family transcriptional regulator